jgi:uncharacterized protein YllA (UPF0747 family)
LATAAAGLERDFGAIRREAAAMDGSLGQTADGVHRKIQHQMGVMENKVIQAAKKKQAVQGQKMTKLENALMPNGHLQERYFNVTPFLFKYGFSWLEGLYQAVDLTHFDHQVLRMGVED